MKTLMLVENFSVPSDRRVWQECLALRGAGFDVAVICPQGETRDLGKLEVRDGIEIYRYPARYAKGGRLGYVAEYTTAVYWTARLIDFVARKGRIDVVHAANPPDVLLLAALPLRQRGAAFVFDHHDLAPELYLSRFSRTPDALHRVLLLLERTAFAIADVVISTNESYRRVAIERGRKSPADVFVVRSAPSSVLAPVEPDASLKRGKPFLLAYVGVIGEQDGVRLALRALARLKEMRWDWHATFVGDGEGLPAARRLADELGLADCVEFTGWLDNPGVAAVLSSADVCLTPDPKNPFNDVSTMTKIPEYMAFSRPIVSFELRESRVSAGAAAVYARANSAESFAACIDALLNDPRRRHEMGTNGRARVEGGLSWSSSTRSLLAAYDRGLELAWRRTRTSGRRRLASNQRS